MAHVETNPNLQEQLKAYMMRQLKIRADYVEQKAKEFCPVDTGTLKDSIETQKQPDGYEVGSFGISYAKYIEFGTTRHGPVAFVRRAVAAMLLAFSKR